MPHLLAPRQKQCWKFRSALEAADVLPRSWARCVLNHCGLSLSSPSPRLAGARWAERRMHHDTCLDTAETRNNRRPCTAAATLLLPIYRACTPVYRAFSPRGMLLPSWPALPASPRSLRKECPTAAPLVIQLYPAYVLHLTCDSHRRLQAITIRISAHDEHHAGRRNKSVGRLAEWSPRRHTSSPGYIHLSGSMPKSARSLASYMSLVVSNPHDRDGFQQPRTRVATSEMRRQECPSCCLTAV